MNGTEATVGPPPLERAGASTAPLPVPAGGRLREGGTHTPVEGGGRSVEGSVQGVEIPVVAAQLASWLPASNLFSVCLCFWSVEAVEGTAEASASRVRGCDGGPSVSTLICPASNSRSI